MSPQPLGLRDGLGAVADAELLVQRGGVLLDRVGGEVQPCGDLGVGGPGGDELEDLALARG
jgi:hypothetical protein